MILCIRSESPTVYVGLWDNGIEKLSESWEAGRELSNQLLSAIQSSLNSYSRSMADIKGVIIYEGPGSYTGLRISISVANSIGYSNKIPVVGVSGVDWIEHGLQQLKSVNTFIKPVFPQYGGEVHTTKPRK